MSAFVVNDSHIDVIVQAGLKSHSGYRGPCTWYWAGNEENEPVHGKITRDTADEVGQILMDENVRSVNFRYKDEIEDEPYTYTEPVYTYTPAEVFKAIDCLDYQSCETPDWKETKAYAILQAIQAWTISGMQGYENAQWEVVDPCRMTEDDFGMIADVEALEVVKGDTFSEWTMEARFKVERQAGFLADILHREDAYQGPRLLTNRWGKYTPMGQIDRKTITIAEDYSKMTFKVHAPVTLNVRDYKLLVHLR